MDCKTFGEEGSRITFINYGRAPLDDGLNQEFALGTKGKYWIFVGPPYKYKEVYGGTN
jgi:hypothetical protein